MSTDDDRLTPERCGSRFGLGARCTKSADHAGSHSADDGADIRRVWQDGLPNEGVKFDSDKPKWSLLPWDAIKEVVIVFTRGAQKYEERNWEKGMAWSRVYNSMQRHATDWFQYRMTHDPDGTGLRNIAQVAWSALVLCAYELRGIGKDDRPNMQKEETCDGNQSRR